MKQPLVLLKFKKTLVFMLLEWLISLSLTASSCFLLLLARMESSKIFGGDAEECESSESGWTMYIGSPIGGDDGEIDEGTHDDAHNLEDESDDDSMASDASSRPFQYDKGGYGSAAEEECDENKYCLDKKASETQEKKLEAKKVMSSVQDGGKVSKNYWVCKRK